MRHAKKGHRVISMDILEHLHYTGTAKPSDRYLRADFASFLSKTGVLQLSGLKGAVSGLYPKND